MKEYPYEHRRITGSSAKLDIGCGSACHPGFTGIDVRDCKQAVIWDVREGIPFPDNSVQEIYTSHFVEHLDEKEIFNFLMEVLRVCKVGASVRIVCPHADEPEALFPAHVSFWNEKKIAGLVKGSAGAAKYVNKKFQLIIASKQGFELRAVLKVVNK